MKAQEKRHSHLTVHPLFFIFITQFFNSHLTRMAKVKQLEQG